MYANTGFLFESNQLRFLMEVFVLRGEKPVKVLHVVGRMGIGGQETMIMNIYRNIDRSKLQFDFLVHTTEKNFYDDEILKMGGVIHNVVRKSENPFKNILQTYRVIKKGNYKAVHIHTSSSILAINLFLAMLAGVKIRIAHSHSTTTKGSFIHKLLIPFLNIVTTQKFACSIDAGQWLFGKKSCKRLIVVNNGVDSRLYSFKYEKSIEMKESLGIADKFVLLHVGRFETVKNHTFLIDIFEEVLRINPNAILLLVGGGKLVKNIQDKINNNNLGEKVKILGVRNDISDIMQASDVFVMPSINEGLPLSLIEAQSSGLPCLISDSITKETKITGLLTFISLIESPEIWARAIIQKTQNTIRENKEQSIINAGFDIKDIAIRIQDFYCNGETDFKAVR